MSRVVGGGAAAGSVPCCARCGFYSRLTPFRPHAEKTKPGTVAYVPGMAHRARAGSVGQTRVEAWSRHIARRDDREALCIVFHVYSSQNFLVRDTACFDSGVVPRATLLLIDSPE